MKEEENCGTCDNSTELYDDDECEYVFCEEDQKATPRHRQWEVCYVPRDAKDVRECCATCKHCYPIDEVGLLRHGLTRTYFSGYACLGKTELKGFVYYGYDIDPNESWCELYERRVDDAD